MTVVRRLARGAADAFCGAGIKIKPTQWNVFAAIFAKAELAFIHPRKRGMDAGALGRASGAGGLRHGLVLQRIHAAEPSNSLLIQHDRLLRGCPAGVASVQRVKRFGQLCAICRDLGFIHVCYPCYHGFEF